MLGADMPSNYLRQLGKVMGKGFFMLGKEMR